MTQKQTSKKINTEGTKSTDAGRQTWKTDRKTNIQYKRREHTTEKKQQKTDD